MDLHFKSQQLLEKLANSVHDRENKSVVPFFFSIAEIHLTEKWLSEFITEIKKDCVCV